MNYKLINRQYFDKMGVTVFLYEHNKTKAQIVYVKNDDKNKTFGIGFKTPPTNSKGMAHIMEHSVLNGSKKYHTKDPFMDMASSSLQTFLNAMTYPDKTIFPVSSENDKDFYNLTDVYLDAVFNPLVMEKREILDQEGRHYELDDNDKIVGISGVVYNEMKGALTDPDEIVNNNITQYLYKGSPYEYESGGDPKDIYKLTYDEFRNFYKNHYHPSNSYIYFYGDLDIDFYLEHLDNKYLSKYEYRDIDTEIKVNENKYEKAITGYYPVSKVEEDSDYLSYSFLASNGLDIKEYITLNILVIALFNMDSSKIRNKITEEISPEYFYGKVGYGNRSSVIIEAQKASSKKLDSFIEIIEQGLKEASKGINKESLKSAFSLFEFSQREQLNSVNRGLIYYSMRSFDADIFEIFNIINYLDELRDLIDTDYYEKFIEKYFIDNPTKLIYIAEAKSDYSKDNQNKLNEYLLNINSNMTDDKLKAIKEDLKNLDIYQNKEDSEEDKKSIPRLNIEDVPVSVEEVPRFVEDDINSYVFHDLETSGIIYTSMYYNINHLDINELQYLTLINELLASVDTENMPYQQIDDVVWQYMSGLSFNIQNIKINKEKLNSYEKVSFKATAETITRAISLVKDFVFNSLFDNKNRVIELLRSRKSIFESRIYDAGHLIAINRANSHIDKAAMIKESLNGIDYYMFLKNIIKSANLNFEELSQKLKEIYKKVFTNDLIINITSSKEDYEIIKAIINKEFVNLSNRDKDKEIIFKANPIKEAISSDANVNYVSKSANLKDFGYEFDGKLYLSTSILSNPYLYELIRAKGGAYGAGVMIDRSDILATYSYRDPNIMETLDSFDKMKEITENIEMSERDFENQQISSMGTILKPKTAQQKGERDFIIYMKEYYKDDEEILKEIKDAKLSDIKSYADVFGKAMDYENLAVFGNREEIDKVSDYFDNIIDLNDYLK